MAKPIGVLALQGGFSAHGQVLATLGHEVVWVRSKAALGECGGLVLPGGESTVLLKLMAAEGMGDALMEFVRSGYPVLATCAGLVLSATQVEGPSQPSFGFVDVTVQRNGWGRQNASFEATDDSGTIPIVAIRAPRITRVGAAVKVLATLGGEPMWVRYQNVMGCTFHPELTTYAGIHEQVFGRT